MGKDAAPAFDELHQRAEKRNKAPSRFSGKIGDPAAAGTLHDFIDGDGDASLQKIVLRARSVRWAATSRPSRSPTDLMPTTPDPVDGRPLARAAR